MAVASFLNGKLSYTSIAALIENTLTWHAGRPPWALNSLEDVMALDAEARRQALKWISP
jgi:1-deoxy-D-xylulose-5-phosphate reductoisomerase